MLRDGTGILQGIFFKPEIGEVLFNEFKTLTQESSISVEGKIISYYIIHPKLRSSKKLMTRNKISKSRTSSCERGQRCS